MDNPEIRKRKSVRRKGLFYWLGDSVPVNERGIPRFLLERADQNFVRLQREGVKIPEGWSVKTFFAAAAICAALTSLKQKPAESLLKNAKVNLILDPTKDSGNLNFEVKLAGRNITGKMFGLNDSKAGWPIYVSHEGKPGTSYLSFDPTEGKLGKIFLKRLNNIISLEKAIDSSTGKPVN